MPVSPAVQDLGWPRVQRYFVWNILVTTVREWEVGNDFVNYVRIILLFQVWIQIFCEGVCGHWGIPAQARARAPDGYIFQVVFHRRHNFFVMCSGHDLIWVCSIEL